VPLPRLVHRCAIPGVRAREHRSLMFQVLAQKSASVPLQPSSAEHLSMPCYVWHRGDQPVESMFTAGPFYDGSCSNATSSMEVEDPLPADLTNLFARSAPVCPTACSATPKASEMPEGKQEGHSCRIKNTFIVVGEDMAGELQDVELHDGGAQTWAASDLRPRKSLEAEVLEEHYSSPKCCLKEPFDFRATPGRVQTPSDMAGHHERHHSTAQASPVPRIPASTLPPQQLNDTDAATLYPPLVAANESSLILLQVPVILQGDPNSTLLGCRNVSPIVMVEEQKVDAATGAVSLQLRVLLMPRALSAGMSPKSLSQQQPPSPSLAGARLKQQRQATPGEAAAKKGNMVCIHWSDKGRCRYGDLCKFMHPADKRGVTAEAPELPKVAVPAPKPSRHKHGNRASGTLPLPLPPSNTTSQVPALQAPCPLYSHICNRGCPPPSNGGRRSVL